MRNLKTLNSKKQSRMVITRGWDGRKGEMLVKGYKCSVIRGISSGNLQRGDYNFMCVYLTDLRHVQVMGKTLFLNVSVKVFVEAMSI